MATFLSLPSEVLDDICHYLQADCLKSLGLTCHELHPVVRRVLFKDVFAYPDMESLDRAFQLAQRKGFESPKSLVRSFTLSGRAIPDSHQARHNRGDFKRLVHDANYSQRAAPNTTTWNNAQSAYKALIRYQKQASSQMPWLLKRCINKFRNLHTIAFDAAMDWDEGYSRSNIPTRVPRTGPDGAHKHSKNVCALFIALERMETPSARIKNLILDGINPEWIDYENEFPRLTPEAPSITNITMNIVPDEYGPSHLENYQRTIRAVLAKTPSLLTLDIRHRESKWPFPQNRPSNLYELASLSPTTWAHLRELRLCGWFSRAGMVSSLLSTMANTLKILYLEDIQLFPDLKVKDETEDNWAIYCQEWFPLLEWMAKKLTLSSLTLRGRLAEALFGTHVASPGEGFRARVERYVTRGGAAPFRMYQGLWRFECDATWMSTAVDSGGPPLENFWWVKGYQYADSSSDESDSD